MIKPTQKLAHDNIVSLKYEVRPSALETLRTIDFEIARAQSMDQRDLTRWNLDLDRRSCLGKAAQAAAVIEKHFPDTKLEIGEVWQDYLAGLMIFLLSQMPDRKYDPSFMTELLMYEEPHLVIFVDGVQFEPLSMEFGEEIQHPRVQAFPLWEAITASMLISRSYLEDDLVKKLAILKQAETVCPGMVLTCENMCEPLELLGYTDKVIEIAKWCHERRPCARTLYVLWVFTKEKKYHDLLIEKYSEEIIKYF